ncbi:DUF3293 domain-containing protein [Ideonella sp. DXS22W]|uniref:DUF3293 domain-containing protein n=1 Tax=Pseudaquabacterium inlustre TaxID=2984192 RepID=A0ABU9CJG5_9BURK
MFPDTQIAAALIQAYRETHYEVRPADTAAFTLHIDQPCAGLRAAHQRHGVACSAFITACNPYSQALDDAANAARQAALLAKLEAQGRRTDAGQGRHPANGWPAEPSLLVYGLGLEAARALGRQLEQNAIVWCGADAVPRLVLLR